MTPKEKSQELILKHLRVNHGFNVHIARQCALISVNEMLSNDGWCSSLNEWERFKNYFEQVKQELEKL